MRSNIRALFRDAGTAFVATTVLLVAAPTAPAAADATAAMDCRITTTPSVGQGDASVEITATGVAERTASDPTQYLLSQTAVSLPFPTDLLQTGVDSGLIQDGDVLSTSAAALVFGSGLAAGQKTLRGSAPLTLHVVGGVLQPLTANFPLPNSNWHFNAPSIPLTLSLQSVTLQGQLNAHGLGPLEFDFACTPVFLPARAFTVAPLLQISPGKVQMGSQRVGTFGDPNAFALTNRGATPISVLSLGLVGTNSFDFFGDSNCVTSRGGVTLAPGANCHVRAFFEPTNVGARKAQIVIGTSIGGYTVPIAGTGTEGFYLAGAQGEVANFGDAVFHGDASALTLTAPMISMATTPNGAGYWLLGRDGGIFSYGNAHFYGSTGGIKLNKPVVAMSTSRGGKGYRLVASDGGIFAFGDAGFYGSTGGITLNQPIVGMASTISGRGYWLVASDGGIFAFGDARFFGSTAGTGPASPIIQITPTPSGKGYWLLAAQGQLYAFGDAHNYGSAPGQTMAGMSATPDGRGYWEATRSGRVLNFGDAHSYGDIANLGVNDVIAIAGTSPPLPVGLLKPAAQAAGPGRSRSFGSATGSVALSYERP